MFLLESRWVVDAAPDRVWAAMVAVEQWPTWWPGITEVTVIRRTDGGDPSRVALVVRSPLGYRLRFGVEIVAAEPPSTAFARVVGDLVGTGEWAVTPTASGCVATVRWHVSPARPPLSTIAPLFVGPLTWAHAVVMRRGEAALRRRVDGS